MQLFLHTKKGLALLLGMAMMLMLAGCGADSAFDNNVKGSGLEVTVSPADGATNVFLNTDITGTFNKDIRQDTLIEGTTFYLLDPNNNMVPGSWSYLNKVLRFKPDANLTENTTYRFVITNGIRATDYARLGGDVVTQFTTGTLLGLTVTLNPQQGDTNVSLNPNITATFNEPVDIASVDGNSFYLLDKNDVKVPVTSIEHTDDNTTLILKLASNLAPFETYTTVVTTDVTAPTGHMLAADEEAMFVTGDWLHLAVSINPPDGATNVPINTMITATFNKPMDLSTLNSGNIYLMDENGTHVPGTLHTATDASGNTVVTFILDPGTTLAPNSDYTFVVENDVTSLDGEQLGTDETSTFTTGTQTELQVYIVPADGETGVAVTDNIVAYFNEDVNDTTLDGTTFYLENNVTGVIPGAISYDGANYIAVFNPDANLTAYTTYTFTVTTGVEAVNGDTLASDASSTFTTGNLIRVIDAAVFTMNSNAATVDTNESSVLGGLTGNLLGTQLQVDAAGVQGLAETDVQFVGFVTGLANEVNATTIEDLVDSNLTVTQALQVLADQYGAIPAGPAQDVINQLIAAIDSNGTDQTINVSDLLQFPASMLPMDVTELVSTEDLAAATTDGIAILSGLNSALMPVAESIIEVPLDLAGLLGADGTLRAQLVSPAAYAVMVEGDTIKASQSRIQLHLQVDGGLLTGLLGSLTDLLNTLLLGLVTIDVPTLVDIPLYIVLAEAEGTLETLSVDEIVMAVQNGLAKIYLGAIPDDIFFSDQVIGAEDFDAVSLLDLNLTVLGIPTPIKVDVKAFANGSPSAFTPMNFMPINVAQTDSAFAPLGDTTDALVADLVANLELNVTVGALTLGTSDPLLGTILGSVTDLLANTIVPALSPVLNSVSELLGTYTGRADVTMLGLIEHYIVQP
ncbi:Ig-like domain-containing protein [Thiomicrolovo sp. ZZH C-3]